MRPCKKGAPTACKREERTSEGGKSRVVIEEIERLKELTRLTKNGACRLEKLWSAATKTTAMLDGLPHGSAMRSKVEESVIKIDAAAKELESQMLELVALHNQLKAELESLPYAEALVLSMRYVEGKAFRQISDHLSISVDRVFKIHKRGLKKILKLAVKEQ